MFRVTLGSAKADKQPNAAEELTHPITVGKRKKSESIADLAGRELKSPSNILIIQDLLRKNPGFQGILIGNTKIRGEESKKKKLEGASDMTEQKP